MVVTSLPEAAAALREQLLSRTPVLAAQVAPAEDTFLAALAGADDPFAGYGHVPAVARQRVAGIEAVHGEAVRAAYLHWQLTTLALDFEARFARSALPEAFASEFRSNLLRMMQRGLAQPDWPASLGDDVFLKDLGIARFTLVPCVSHLVYRHSGVPRRALLTPSAPWRQRFAVLGRLAEAGGFRPFLENHVHPAMLSHFDAAGRERCFALVAALLRHWPDSRGLMGTSWYYDPALARVSPHLAYLHDGPVSRGAVVMDMGASDAARAGATARSARRRDAVARGDYQPRNYLMVWSRQRMLRHFPA